MVPNKSTHHRFGDGGLTQAETSKVWFNESEMEAPWCHIYIYCSIYVCMFTSTEWFRCLNVFCILWFLDSRYLVEPAADFSMYICTSDRLANGWLCLHIHIIFNIWCKIMYLWHMLSELLSWALFFQRSRTSWRLAPVNSRPKSITSYGKARVISGQPSDPKGYLLYYITTKHKITCITREKKNEDLQAFTNSDLFPFRFGDDENFKKHFHRTIQKASKRLHADDDIW